MRSCVLALCLIFSTLRVFAATCSADSGNDPCAPEAGEDTDKSKADILKLIKRAQTLAPKVAVLEAQFREVRDGADKELALATFEKYRAAKLAEGKLYKDALDQTEQLYHVYPDDSGTVRIAKPYDPAMEWMSGLTANWDPQATDSGPGVKLAVRIGGSDGDDHYGGMKEMDPSKSRGLLAITLPDGRVLILKGTFAQALKESNPAGYLAAVLYHESRHFNHLSRTPRDESGGVNRSWGYKEEEERDAYHEEYLMANVFGLSNKVIRDVKAQWREYDQDVRAGKLSSFNSSAADGKRWEAIYNDPNGQINLKEEYDKLKAAVDAAHEASDRRLAYALRDIAVKACKNPDSVAVGEVENLPNPHAPDFDKNYLPKGLGGGCALALYSYLVTPMAPGKWQTRGTIRDFVHLYFRAPVSVPSPSPSFSVPPPTQPFIMPPPMNPYLLLRAFRDLAVKACQSPENITQADFDRIGSFPTSMAIPGAEDFAAALSGCTRLVFDRMMEANRPGGQLTGAMVARWAVDSQPRQPVTPPVVRRPREPVEPKDPCFQDPGSPRGCTN